MPARPMFDQNQSNIPALVPANPPSPQAVRQDSPLATQLPAWDLLPAHSLLVRRRVVPMEKAAKSADAGPATPAATPAPVQTAPLPKAAASKAVFCTKCGTRCDSGDAFCIKCGARLE